MQRKIATIVSGFSAALALARNSDMIATVPEKHTASLRQVMVCFKLMLAIPEMTVSMLWHPRQQAEQGHRWLRKLVREACGESSPAGPHT